MCIIQMSREHINKVFQGIVCLSPQGLTNMAVFQDMTVSLMLSRACTPSDDIDDMQAQDDDRRAGSPEPERARSRDRSRERSRDRRSAGRTRSPPLETRRSGRRGHK